MGVKKPSEAQLKYWDDKLKAYGLSETQIEGQERWLSFGYTAEVERETFREYVLPQKQLRKPLEPTLRWGYAGGYDHNGSLTGGFKHASE